MKLISKLMATGFSVLLVQFACAAGNDSAPPCPPKECPKPCPPKECPKPCPPKPCPPKPCPKPCPPKPCKPCPPVCFERGYPNDQCCFPSAYNEPANFDLGPCPWDFWVDASFTYWEAYEEGLGLGVSTTVLSDAVQPVRDGTYLFQSNSFKPGFKVGLGMDLGHDDWSVFGEYTWFRSKTSTNSAAPTDSRGGVGVWQFTNWFNRTSTIQSNQNALSISSSWRNNMDLADVGVSRPYYQGTHLIIAPFGTVRGQWIRQQLNVEARVASTTGAFLLNATSSNRSNSWAVGPRGGLLAKWHLGWGFRFEGDVAGAILFTRYTKVSHSESSTSSTTTPVAVSARFRNYNTLRMVNDMNVGIGWGTYLDCRNYHLDLLATYDFQVFWNQNLMRQLADSLSSGAGYSPSNLYLQGLTVRAQFDF